jgi:hypothetical protein
VFHEFPDLAQIRQSFQIGSIREFEIRCILPGSKFDEIRPLERMSWKVLGIEANERRHRRITEIAERASEMLSDKGSSNKTRGEGLRLIGEHLAELIGDGAGLDLAAKVQEIALCNSPLRESALRVFCQLALCCEGFESRSRSFLEAWRELGEGNRTAGGVSYAAAFVAVFGGLELCELEWLSELLEGEERKDLRALSLLHARLCESGQTEGARRIVDGVVLSADNVEWAEVLAAEVWESEGGSADGYRGEFLGRLRATGVLGKRWARLESGERRSLPLSFRGIGCLKPKPFVVMGACRVVQVGAARAVVGGDEALGSLMTLYPRLQEVLCVPVDDPEACASGELKAADAGEHRRRVAKVRRGPRWQRGGDPAHPWVRPRRRGSPGCPICQPWLEKKPYMAHCIRAAIDVGLREYGEPVGDD